MTSSAARPASRSRFASDDFDASMEMRNGKSLAFGLDLNVALGTSDYANITVEDHLDDVSGTFRLGKRMSIEFDGELANLLALDDPTAGQINDALTAELFYGSRRIGALEYAADSTDDEFGQVRIAYKDGSSENAKRYYESFVESLELIVSAYTGDFDTDFD